MKLTQCERIIRHLQEVGPIDDLTAYSEYGIRRLASRIHDLKVRGYDIVAETKTGKNRYGEATHYAVYRLKEETV
jgi:hypothetical protein